MSWFDDAACQGLETELFFPERGEHATYPRSVCAGCPVTSECLAYAVDHGIIYGLWGGLGERARQRYVRRLKRCGWCNGQFEQERRRAGQTVYCSDECRDAARAKTKAAVRERRKANA